MQDKFEAAGYKLPQVVFWNLRASGFPGEKSTPVTYNQEGVALVSGFSEAATQAVHGPAQRPYSLGGMTPQ